MQSCVARANAAAVACSGPVPLPSPFASQQEQVHRLVWISHPLQSEGRCATWVQLLYINAGALQGTHAAHSMAIRTSRREVMAGPCEVQVTGRKSGKDSSGIAPSPFACENVQGPFSSPPPSAA